MSADGALILTYHAIEEGSSPLCVDPVLFRQHLDCLGELGATTMTVSELGAALSAGELPERAVAITFDDGCASAARVAAPLLAGRKQKATFFCVAGHLGGWNDWPSQRVGVPRFELAAASELAELAAQGFEIGAHGIEHAPLDSLPPEALRHEVHGSQQRLAETTGVDVRSYAYPYGALPDAAAARLVTQLFDVACGITVGRVAPTSDPFRLPRVDAHYLRDTRTLARAVSGKLDVVVRMRAAAARARRTVIKDYVTP